MILNPKTNQYVKIDGGQGHSILKCLFRQNINFDELWFKNIKTEYKINIITLKEQYQKYMSNDYFIKNYRSFDLKIETDDGFIENKIYNIHTGQYINMNSHKAKQIYKTLFGKGIVYTELNSISNKYKIQLEDLIEIKSKYQNKQNHIKIKINKNKFNNPKDKLWLFWKNKKLDELKLLVCQKNVKSFINTINADGMSLLYSIIDKYNIKYYDLIELLLQRGADINYCDKFDYESVLFLSVEKNLIQITRLLLKYNADVNLTNAGHETTLHTLLNRNLSENKIIKMVHLLLEYGANPNIINYRKQNCIELSKKYDTIYKLLKKEENHMYLKIQNKEIQKNMNKIQKPLNRYIQTLELKITHIWKVQKIVKDLIHIILIDQITYDELYSYIDDFMKNALEKEYICLDIDILLNKIKSKCYILEPHLSKI